MRSLKQNDYQITQKADRENKTQLLKTVKQPSDMQHPPPSLLLLCFLPGVVTTAANGNPFPIPFAMVTKERKNTTL